MLESVNKSFFTLTFTSSSITLFPPSSSWEILNNLGIICEFEGEGNVHSQSIASGNKVVKGTKVTITLNKEFEY